MAGDSTKGSPIEDEEESVYSEQSGSSFKCFSFNKMLIPYKAYYMFFFSGVGAFVPYEALYFKQLWLNSSQVGFLIAVKPFCHFCMAPMWSSLSDLWNRRKSILLAAVFFWSLTNLLLGFLPPAGTKPNICDGDISNVVAGKHTYQIGVGNISKEDNSDLGETQSDEGYLHFERNRVRKSEETTQTESSVKIIQKVIIIGPEKDDSKLWVPNTFILAFFILVLGHLVAAPSQTLSNTSTLEALDNDIDQFGFQRCFGAFGWGLGSFLTGLFLIFSHRESLQCPEYNEDGTDFRPCLFVSAVLIFLSFICAIFFKPSKGGSEQKQEDVWLKFQLAMSSNIIAVLLLALYCGAMKGAIEAFLFWHLQQMGASQLLIALVTLVNALGEMCGFLSAQLIVDYMGHIRVMYIVLVAYSIRFLFFYMLTNPWYVLAIEWIRGLTFSVFWATCISYLGLIPGVMATLQSILHGTYWGLGYSLGPAITGLLISQIGTSPTFLAYAFFTIVVLGAFALVNVGFGKITTLENFLQQGYDRIDREGQKHEDDQSDYDF